MMLVEKSSIWLESGTVGSFKFKPPTADELLFAIPSEMLMVTKQGQFKFFIATLKKNNSNLKEHIADCYVKVDKHHKKSDEVVKVLVSLEGEKGGCELCQALFFARVVLGSEWIFRTVYAALHEGTVHGAMAFSDGDARVLKDLFKVVEDRLGGKKPPHSK